MASLNQITELLVEWSNGDKAALDKMVPIIHGELRRLASSYLRKERKDHTLQTSALINEAYLRLVDCKSIAWKNRAQFFAVSAQIMRHILIDHARKRQTDRRGGPAQKVPLDDVAELADKQAAHFVVLNDALDALSAIDPKKARIVELQYFGGLTAQETAAVLDISSRTVEREWRKARAWLYREITGGNSNELGAMETGR